MKILSQNWNTMSTVNIQIKKCLRNQTGVNLRRVTLQDLSRKHTTVTLPLP